MKAGIVSVLAALLWQGPTFAAPPLKKEAPTGSRVVQTVEQQLGDSAEIRKVQAKFGECVVKGQYEASRRWVLFSDLEPRERRRVLAKVTDSGCLTAAFGRMYHVQMRFPGDTMRHTLAEALVKRDLTAAAMPALKNAARVAQPVFDEAHFVPTPVRKLKQEELAQLAENRSKQIARVYLAEFGECVVRFNAVDSFALIAAPPATNAEQATFTRLLPAFGQCLAAGERLTFNKSVLRGTIAMNLYRLANAPAAITPAGAPR